MSLPTLKQSVLGYCNRINETWSDDDSVSARSIQRRFVYAQAYGALKSSRSYWILKEHDQHNDAFIILRNLTERIANSFYAKNSSKNACELAAYELNQDISIINNWNSHDQERDDIIPTDLISDLTAIEELLPNKEYKNIKPWKKFAATGLSFIHKGSYAQYCKSTHPTIHSALSNKETDILDDYYALLIPVECSFVLHGLLCDSEDCEEIEEYKKVTQPIKDYLKTFS